MDDYSGHNWTLHVGHVLDVLKELPERSVQCCVTSPPYFGLRDYGVDGQIGLESTPAEYVASMVEVFAAVRRVLRDDGTLWLNLGDSRSGSWGNYHPNSPPGKHGQRLKETARWNRPAYDDQARRPPTADVPGLKKKDLIGIPWEVAFALRADGWYLRSDIIWHKPNVMPESVRDRPSTCHEYLFLLAKSERYFFDMEAIKERSQSGPSDVKKMLEGRDRIGGKTLSDGEKRHKANGSTNIGTKRAVGSPDGRQSRSVWKITTQPYRGAHFATFPEKLPARCIMAGTSEAGCCPECGAPWKRVVERDRQPTRPGKNNCSDESGMANRDEQRHVTATKTVGWEAGCGCIGPNIVVPQNTVPCVVLDPFAGSGTTLKVARELGRHGIGIELSAEYAEMAEKRIMDLRRHAAPGQKPIVPMEGQKTFF